MEHEPVKPEVKLKAGDEAPEESPDVTVKIELFLPENVPAYYSDAATVLHSGREFVISFLQTEFPLATSKADLEQVKVVKRNCIARVFLSPSHFQEFAKVCQDQMDKYLEAYKKPETN